MKRFASRSLVATALALASLIPAGVFAQTTPITSPLEVEYDGKSLNGKEKVYVTAQQCAEGATGKFKFTAKYLTQVPVFEAWVGKGTTDCSTEASRRKASAASQNPACRRVYLNEASSTQVSFERTARELFRTGLSDDVGSSDDDAGVEDAGTSDAGVEDASSADATIEDASTDEDTSSDGTGCDEVSNQTYTVFILPLQQATEIGSDLAYPVIPGTVSTLKATFTLYTKRPSAPSGLSGGSGESLISVSFKTVAGAPAMTKYRAYFDWGEGGEDCGSGKLVSGEPSPESRARVATVDTNSGTAELKGLDSKAIAIGDAVAVSVVTVDPAGSESLLAAPICVYRRETESFIDACKKDPECADGLQSCSLQPGSGAKGALALGVVLAGLAIAFVVRRRHV